LKNFFLESTSLAQFNGFPIYQHKNVKVPIGILEGKRVAVVDILGLFDRLIVLPLCGFQIATIEILYDIPCRILSTYHEPEFPNTAEVGTIQKTGGTQIYIGVLAGLQIGQ
jgi:hypothetical protein